MSVLTKAVAGKSATNLVKLSDASVAVKYILERHVESPNLRDLYIGRTLSALGVLDPKDIITVLVRANYLAFKRPMDLYRKNLFHHTTKWWNPTKHRIDIRPLGAIDTEGNPLEYVNPGENVDLPTVFSSGGKYDAVYSVAPQLVKFPVSKESLLDLTPIDYYEWRDNFPLTKSKCCKRTLVWNSQLQTPECSKCGTV